MFGKTSPAQMRRLSSTGSSILLDRIGSQKSLSAQALVDGIVSRSLEEIAKPSLMTAFLGAGLASHLTRTGFISTASPLLPEGGTVLSTFARGGAYATALANESSVFAGIERGFAHLEGHPSSQPFQKDWARAAINLGSLKFFGKLAEGENIILRHLMTDFGMVLGQQGGAALSITEKPEGSMAAQMMEAEAMSLSMEGSLALLHGLSPNLFAMERSLDFYLRNREPLLSSRGRFPYELVPEGGAEGFLTGTREREEVKESNIWKSKKDETQKGHGAISEPPQLLDGGTEFERKLLRSTEGDGLSDEAIERLSVRLSKGSLVSPAIRRFVETALETSDPNEQRSAIKVLATLENSDLRSEILAMVLNWPDPGVQRSAAQVLAELGEIKQGVFRGE